MKVSEKNRGLCVVSCKGCAYAVLLSGVWCCDYLQIAGHRRPCPPGEGCTVRKAANLTKKGSAFMKRREWDTDKAKALYDQKLSDAGIAGKVGTTASAVANWRRSLGLPANREMCSPHLETPELKAAPPPPRPSPLRPVSGIPGHEGTRGAVGGAGRPRLRSAGPGPGGCGANLRIRRRAAEGYGTGRQAEGGN